LAQVVGRKRIRLYAPGNTPFLYPHTGKTLKNTSQVHITSHPILATQLTLPRLRRWLVAHDITHTPLRLTKL
jgi:hypothetical protein